MNWFVAGVLVGFALLIVELKKAGSGIFEPESQSHNGISFHPRSGSEYSQIAEAATTQQAVTSTQATTSKKTCPVCPGRVN
jgi:hypothetical protein